MEPRDNYRAYSRALIALHRLELEGRGESPEADGIRESMDAVWALLTEDERKRLKQLSEDLITIFAGAC